MSTYEHTVIVERPVRVVYNQWTQFEKYPDFMDDVEQVQQFTDTFGASVPPANPLPAVAPLALPEHEDYA
jgi:uncharacterized membrane protein